MASTAADHVFPLRDAAIAVTGAASGIGRATVLMALAGGAKVAAIDLDRAGLDLLAEEARAGDRLILSTMDVTDCDAIAAEWERIAGRIGTVTGLVCSAGVSYESPLLEITPDLWDKVVRLNLAGTFFVAQAAARAMIAAETPGSIVTISSALGVQGRVNGAHYSASKAGVIGLTKSMALELAPHRIRVNCVAPGGVETPLMRRVLDARPGAAAAGLSRIALGRFGQPEELAASICFLLSDLSAWTTGQTLHVNGGSLLP